MRIVTTFVFLAGLILLLSAIFQVNINIGQPTASDGSFSARLGKPIRLAIVGDADAADALRAQIYTQDKRDLFDRDARPADVADADAIIFLLNGWDEIAQAPWQDRFASDYAIVADSEDDSFSLSMADGDRPLNRAYYNLIYYSTWGYECYATLTLHDLGGTPGTSIVLPDTCD